MAFIVAVVVVVVCDEWGVAVSNNELDGGRGEDALHGHDGSVK